MWCKTHKILHRILISHIKKKQVLEKLNNVSLEVLEPEF